jgi:large subunit ribosomal protein L29
VKASQVRELSDEELSRKLEDSSGSYMKLRFQHATAQLDSHAKIKVARRDLARMKTELGTRNRKAKKAQG